MLSLVAGRKSTLTVEDDSRSVFLVEPFCFVQGGSLKFQATGLELSGVPTDSPTDTGKKSKKKKDMIGFLVRRIGEGGAYAVASMDEVASRQCLLTKAKPEDHVVRMVGNNTSFSLDITDKNAGLYSIVYSNCREGSRASFSLAVELMNQGGVYLSAGDIPLPVCYAVVGLLFLGAGVVWYSLLFKNRDTAYKIHWLMGALVMVKAFVLLFEAFRYESIKRTGSGYGWSTIYYVLTFIKGLMLFSTILLIGTGWSFLKPFLNTRDKRILLVVLPLQVVVNTAMVVVEETPPGTMGWMTWRDVLHFFDVVCCCAILFPIVWSIRHLREAALADGKARRTLDKLKLFREFYVMVVCYIYFTRIVVYLVRATLSCELGWVAKLSSELASLAFYVLVGLKFRPHADNPYLRVDDEDRDGVELQNQLQTDV